MILKNLQNESSKDISTLLLVAGQQEKRMKTKFGQLCRTLFTNCSCSCPPHFGGRIRQGIAETAYSRLCIGTIGEPTKVEKMDRCSFIGVGKYPGRNSVT